MNLYEILTNSNIIKSINDNLDEMLLLIPELKFIIGFDHKHPHHHLDVWEHTLYALSLSENNFEIRLCLLLHDIGKPFSYQEDGEIRHYFNHAKVSSIISEKILKRLKYKDDFISEVCYLIKYHDTPIKKKEILENYNLQEKRYKIQTCDALAHNPEKLEKRKKYLNKTKKLLYKQNVKQNEKYSVKC